MQLFLIVLTLIGVVGISGFREREVEEAGKEKSRIGIVYPEDNLDSVPSICNAASLLSKEGWIVDIFTHISAKFNAPSFSDSRITIRRLRPVITSADTKSVVPRRWHRKVQGIRDSSAFVCGMYQAPKVFYQTAKGLIIHAIRLKDSIRNSLRVWKLHRQCPYHCFIGIDANGLLMAHAISRLVRVPVVYYSLEILLSKDLITPKDRQLKKKELLLSRNVAFVVIPGQERAELLAKENKIPIRKFVLVPNSPLGFARRQPSSYWHKRFGLPSEYRIILHTGGTGRWTGIREIVSSVKSWPENWILVVHTRYDTEMRKSINELRQQAIPERVFFSLSPIKRQEYQVLVDGADIGIAFYIPGSDHPYNNTNIKVLGLSSGKIAHYLHAGLPVIINRTPSISKLISNEGCGVSVEETTDIGKAIAQIERDYEEYSKRACSFFEKHLKFESNFQKVLDRISMLESKRYG